MMEHLPEIKKFSIIHKRKESVMTAISRTRALKKHQHETVRDPIRK